MSHGAAEVASVVLAAGASRRMGEPKPLLRCGAGTLLAAAVAPHLSAGIGRVVVVLGHEAERVRREAGLPDDPRLRVVDNPDWHLGMASSLRRGLLECDESLSAVLVALADQPGVTPARVVALLEAWASRPQAPLAVPVLADGRPSHPVLFARSVWDELRTLEGDVGGREVVRRHWREAVRVPAQPLHDLDTPEDVRRWRAISHES